MLDASEYLSNPANGKSIACFTLHDLLYRITLENKLPFFLQLTQRPSGEVDAVIPNTPKVESMAERMNVQIAVWCLFTGKNLTQALTSFIASYPIELSARSSSMKSANAHGIQA